eukprot:GHVQ01015311.1.p1 GENE.GHVQ01015311.1~~GHVQ01015311.1.p1  ORF type:complete len:106 (-),score=8.94 GHVQ01015311.1:64-381(-)
MDRRIARLEGEAAQSSKLKAELATLRKICEKNGHSLDGITAMADDFKHVEADVSELRSDIVQKTQELVAAQELISRMRVRVFVTIDSFNVFLTCTNAATERRRPN